MADGRQCDPLFSEIAVAVVAAAMAASGAELAPGEIGHDTNGDDGKNAAKEGDKCLDARFHIGRSSRFDCTSTYSLISELWQLLSWGPAKHQNPSSRPAPRHKMFNPTGKWHRQNGMR